MPRGSWPTVRDQIPAHLLVALLQLCLDVGADRLRHQLLLRLLPVARVVFEHVERLQVQLVVLEAEHERLVHHRHLGADGTMLKNSSMSSG